MKTSGDHNLIRDERRRAGLTQEHLAYLVGCDRSQIAQIERGVRRPSLEIAMKLELIFAQPVYRLFDRLRQMSWREVISRARELNQKLLPGCLDDRGSEKTGPVAEVLASLGSRSKATAGTALWRPDADSADTD